MKTIVCDSSSLISLGDNCYLNLLPFFKEKHGIKFVIPESIHKEIYRRPYRTKRFKLKAIKMKEMIDQGYLEVIDSQTVKDYAERFSKLANSLLTSGGHEIEIIHQGEIETIALTKHLGARNLMIDERTTRLLIENTAMLRDYLSSQVEKKIEIDRKKKGKIKMETQDINVIRSSELIALAYEEGYFKNKKQDILEASLYALKYAGCAIKHEEINDYLKIIK